MSSGSELSRAPGDIRPPLPASSALAWSIKTYIVISSSAILSSKSRISKHSLSIWTASGLSAKARENEFPKYLKGSAVRDLYKLRVLWSLSSSKPVRR